ncbi:MAG TPA: PAS domain-containing protein [Gemmatimonadales bacterium]|nr:PAS domain-containing protein [Gemmatimonadales bacterium]
MRRGGGSAGGRKPRGRKPADGSAAGDAKDATARRGREAIDQSLFENLAEGVAVCRAVFEHGVPADYVYLAVNPSFERLTGLSAVVGKRVTDVIPGIRDSNPDLMEAYGRVAATGRPERLEACVLGVWFTVSAYSSEPGQFTVVFDNITERKRAEERLTLQNLVLATQQETSLDGILVVDDGGHIVAYNGRFVQLFRLPPELVAARDDRPVLESVLARVSDPQGFLARVRYLYEHREEKSQEEVALTDGRTIERYSAPMFDAGGGYHGRVWYFRDVTERRQAEATLRWERFLMRTLMENLPDPIYFKDADSRFLTANQAWARRVGLADPGQAVGKTDFEFFASDHAEAARRTEQEILRTGLPVVDLEELETWPDRPSAWVSTTKMPLRDEDGRIIGTFGISRDITERRRAEDLLRRSEAEFRSLVEHAPVGIYRSTRSGRFLTVNPALVRMLGYRWAEELLRLDMARDVYAEPAERARLLAERSERAEVTWKRRDGSPITVELTFHGIPSPEGEEEQFEGVVVDVTGQRSLENQFRQAQRLEAVGRLAGGVAHDFNNVLTAITGYSDLVLEDLAPDDPKRADLEEIRTAAQRAAALTRQLLAFSRKQVLQSRVLDLNTVVQSLEKMLRRLIGEDVQLAFSPGAELWRVRADPGQIEQVILNLAVNSRDAMPSGGRLTIETANVELDAAYTREHAGATPGRYVLLAVSDTGTGMDAETRSHIFEPFFTTKEQGKGTGLGLATVYGIVKQSGGYVWVYSEPGRGATFKMYLPRVDAPVEEQEPSGEGADVPGGGEAVLVAEDDPAVRAIVADVLSQKGYRVMRAPDGQSALGMAGAHAGRIDLLITDLVMPGMTGRELAEALAAVRPGVRVLYISGYTDDAVVRHGVLEEGLAYLQKPFTPRALARKVREMLDRP